MLFLCRACGMRGPHVVCEVIELRLCTHAARRWPLCWLPVRACAPPPGVSLLASAQDACCQLVVTLVTAARYTPLPARLIATSQFDGHALTDILEGASLPWSVVSKANLTRGMCEHDSPVAIESSSVALLTVELCATINCGLAFRVDAMWDWRSRESALSSSDRRVSGGAVRPRLGATIERASLCSRD